MFKCMLQLFVKFQENIVLLLVNLCIRFEENPLVRGNHLCDRVIQGGIYAQSATAEQHIAQVSGIRHTHGDDWFS